MQYADPVLSLEIFLIGTVRLRGGDRAPSRSHDQGTKRVPSLLT
ncbi:MAG: hypothetical protein AB4040_00765 [Synechococcus sp.]